MDGEIHVALLFLVSDPRRLAFLAGAVFLLEVAEDHSHTCGLQRLNISKVTPVRRRQPGCKRREVPGADEFLAGRLDERARESREIKPFQMLLVAAEDLRCALEVEVVERVIKVEAVNERDDTAAVHSTLGEKKPAALAPRAPGGRA